MLSTARTVIVDEIHAVADDKRGSHLALSLERLEALVGAAGGACADRPLRHPAADRGGGALPGGDGEAWSADGTPRCEIVDAGHGRRLDLAGRGAALLAARGGDADGGVGRDLRPPGRADPRAPDDARLRQHPADGRARHPPPRRPAGGGAGGRPPRQPRQGAAAGESSAASSPASSAGPGRHRLARAGDRHRRRSTSSASSARRAAIATLLQRVGRSGHHLGGLPKGRLFPLTRDELSSARPWSTPCAARRARPPGHPRAAARHPGAADRRRGGGRGGGARTASSRWSAAPGPYRDLEREDFDAVVEMLADRLRHPPRAARRLPPPRRRQRPPARPPRGAARPRSPRAAPSPTLADFKSSSSPRARSSARSTRTSPSRAWRATSSSSATPRGGSSRSSRGGCWSRTPRGSRRTIPFWLGEAPARTAELSAAVSRLREELAARLESGADRAGGLAAARR